MGKRWQNMLIFFMLNEIRKGEAIVRVFKLPSSIIKKDVKIVSNEEKKR